MLFVSCYFLVDAARDGFRHVDPRLEDVARTLGYGPLRAFLFVTVPLSWRDLLFRGHPDVGARHQRIRRDRDPTYNPKVASVLIYDRFTTYGLNYALPPALTLVLLSLAVFALLRGISLERGPGGAA